MQIRKSSSNATLQQGVSSFVNLSTSASVNPSTFAFVNLFASASVNPSASGASNYKARSKTIGS
ncbi:unnamed protein product [Prunus armeniaca]|uniref:Uncharacterized protein n=1 Tax=Prunus armeniaca TaxID=36596 RepID=A0A6J5V603_PRUAR|nr:unnamed protein product [Prunus armeniaca]CAB4313936.1 unnamed protein product [Prunus armeniaca]